MGKFNDYIGFNLKLLYEYNKWFITKVKSARSNSSGTLTIAALNHGSLKGLVHNTFAHNTMFAFDIHASNY